MRSVRVLAWSVLSALAIVAASLQGLVGTSSSAVASAGDLDSSFGTGGKVTAQVGGYYSFANAAAVQSDGKIVVVGGQQPLNGGCCYEFAIARYSSAGALDASFGTGGRLITRASPFTNDYANAVAIQSDGKIVVGGYSNGELGLVRLNTDGSLDSTFGTGGKVYTPFTSGFGYINGLAIQPDGSIVAAGQSYDFGLSHYDFAAARFTSTGALDATFGGGTGQLSTAVGPGDNFGSAVALQSDGKIVVAGRGQDPANYDSMVVRYATDGSLDSTFGTGGKVITTVEASNDDGWNGVTIDAGGKIVAAGFSCCPSTGQFTAARYNSDGSLDSGFATGGLFTTSVGTGGSGASSVFVQSDGKIVATGPATGPSGGFGFGAIRLTTSGALDGTYGSGGIVLGPDIDSNDNSFGGAIQSDDKVLILGTSITTNNASSRFATIRLKTDGTVDSSFGSGGLAQTAFGSDDSAAAVTTQTDGKVVEAGNFVNQGGRTTIALARFNPDGTPDTSFGSGGQAIYNNPYSNVDYIATSVAEQQDGKLLVAGDTLISGTQNEVTVVRFNANGSLDTTFGSGGTAQYFFGGLTTGAKAMALQDDGKIDLVGQYLNGPGLDMHLVQLGADGSLLHSFVYQPSPGDDVANAVTVQPDGKIVMAGYGTYGGTGRDFTVVRVGQDFIPDSTFNGTGMVHTDISGLDDVANAVSVQPDGATVVAGTTPLGATTTEFTLVRYTPTGALDGTFGTGGIVSTQSGSSSSPSSVSLTPSGYVVAAGSVTNFSNLDGLVMRYTPSGTLDTTYADFGRQTITYGPATDSINGLAVQPDGRVVVAGGSIVNGTDQDTALARLQDGDPALSIADASTLEGDSGTTNLPFTVSLSTTSRHAVTFSYSTQDGTAHAPGDYLTTSGTGTILAGKSSTTINVPIVGDTKIEPDETFSVNIGSPANASISRGTATGTIQNDDGVAVSVQPSVGPPGTAVSVSGTNFGAHEAVDLFFDSADVGLATANGNGSFSGSITVPATAPGQHVVSAVGRASGLSAQASFTVRSDWAQFRGGAAHQGVNKTESVLSASTAPDLGQGWTAAAAGAVRSPVEGGGLVLATADGDPTLYAVDPSTGTEAWHVTLPAPVTTAAAYGNGEVFAGVSDSSNGAFVALDAQTGALICGPSAGSPIHTDPTVSGHTVYFGTDDGHVFGLKDSTCAPTFVASAGGAISRSLTVGGGRVWAVTGSTLTGFKISNPANTVSFTAGGALTTPAYLNGVVYVGAADGKVRALNAADLSVLWAKDQSTPITSGPAIASNTVVVGASNGRVIALKSSTGAQLWASATTGDAVRGDPTIANGVVYVGSDDKTVSAWKLAGKKGKAVLVWSATTGDAVGSSPAVVNGQVFVGSADGNLYEYDLGTSQASVSVDPDRLVSAGHLITMIRVGPGRALPPRMVRVGKGLVRPPALPRAGTQP